MREPFPVGFMLEALIIKPFIPICSSLGSIDWWFETCICSNVSLHHFPFCVSCGFAWWLQNYAMAIGFSGRRARGVANGWTDFCNTRPGNVTVNLRTSSSGSQWRQLQLGVLCLPWNSNISSLSYMWIPASAPVRSQVMQTLWRRWSLSAVSAKLSSSEKERRKENM